LISPALFLGRVEKAITYHRAKGWKMAVLDNLLLFVLILSFRNLLAGIGMMPMGFHLPFIAPKLAMFVFMA
jgi:hypothetical protein